MTNGFALLMSLGKVLVLRPVKKGPEKLKRPNSSSNKTERKQKLEHKDVNERAVEHGTGRLG